MTIPDKSNRNLSPTEKPVFDPNKHLIAVQGGRKYLPVSARLIWFRSERPDWGISTEPITIDSEKHFAIFVARIYNAEGRLMAMGTKKEDIKGFGDYIEKAETGAVGRALALCGYGTQFAPELDEVGAGRFADSPQQGGGRGRRASGHPAARPSSDYIPSSDDTSAAEGAAPGDLSCASCAKTITQAQKNMSVHNFGERLCPHCQKERTNGRTPAQTFTTGRGARMGREGDAA